MIVFDGDKVGRNFSCTYMANLTLRIVTILKNLPFTPKTSFWLLHPIEKNWGFHGDANGAILVNIVLGQHIAYIISYEKN